MMARLQFVRQFPFLARYNLDTRPDVPFVIDDLRYVHNLIDPLLLPSPPSLRGSQCHMRDTM